MYLNFYQLSITSYFVTKAQIVASAWLKEMLPVTPSSSFGFGLLSHREGKINQYSPFPWPQEIVVRQPTRARKSLPPGYLKLKF